MPIDNTLCTHVRQTEKIASTKRLRKCFRFWEMCTDLGRGKNVLGARHSRILIAFRLTLASNETFKLLTRDKLQCLTSKPCEENWLYFVKHKIYQFIYGRKDNHFDYITYTFQLIFIYLNSDMIIIVIIVIIVQGDTQETMKLSVT